MIHVVVVESHNHALEHIHTVLRQRRLLNRDWSMLHFDSHADLACPGTHIPAISCYRPHMTIRTDQYHEVKNCIHENEITITEKVIPGETDLNNDDDDDLDSIDSKNLYELLDSTSSGISEWILPLVLAANLRSISWVRTPNTIPLIPIGIHQYQVGVYVQPEVKSTTLITKPAVPLSFLDLPLNALVKVDWDCRYYIEDDSVVPTTDLVLNQTLQLTVKEGPSERNVSAVADCSNVKKSKSDTSTAINNLHAIDVCLDYFWCYNPFLKDIESRSATLAKALYDAVVQSKLYSSSYDTRQSAAIFAVELFTFRKQFTKVLKALPTARLQDDLVSALMPFYNNAQIALEVFDRLQEAFNDVECTVEELITALPYVTMPHCWGEIDETLIEQRIMYMRKEILEYSGSISQSIETPFIITIARSTDDGFTPRHVVDYLQDRVLHEIHSISCGCGNRIQSRPLLLSNKSGEDSSLFGAEACSWNLVFDYCLQNFRDPRCAETNTGFKP